VTKPYDCYDAGTFIQKPATKLTSDAWPMVMDDIYNRPTPEKPTSKFITNTGMLLTNFLLTL
jgi:hypothetical protein